MRGGPRLVLLLGRLRLGLVLMLVMLVLVSLVVLVVLVVLVLVVLALVMMVLLLLLRLWLLGRAVTQLGRAVVAARSSTVLGSTVPVLLPLLRLLRLLRLRMLLLGRTVVAARSSTVLGCTGPVVLQLLRRSAVLRRQRLERPLVGHHRLEPTRHRLEPQVGPWAGLVLRRRRRARSGQDVGLGYARRATAGLLPRLV